MLKEEILEEIGLSKNEVKVYLTLLNEGPLSAGLITKKSNANRTNVYDALKRLIKKGLVGYSAKEKKKIYHVTDPENLLNEIKEKEDKLRSILPELSIEKRQSEAKSEAYIYEGLPAAKNILNHILEKKKPIYVMGVSKEVPRLVAPFLINFHTRRIKAKIWMKHIYNTGNRKRVDFLNSLEYTEAKELPKYFDTPVATNICGDEVVMIQWEKNAFVIQIINKNVADAYKKYFELMWKIAKK